MDGSQEINDSIRGQGSFDKAVEALETLQEQKIKHWLSYTVSQKNKFCFPEVLNISKKTNSHFNNVTPYTGDHGLMLDYYEWKEFKYNFLTYARSIRLESPNGLRSCGFTYRCGAFFNGLTINPDGSVCGCARLQGSSTGFEEIDRFLIKEPFLMNVMCMKSKWGHISNFDFLTRTSE